MVWKQLISLFKTRHDVHLGKLPRLQTSSVHPPHREVDPKHIGDLGEYKLDVQLRQMPTEYRYLNDVFIVNSKSKTGYAQIDHILITSHGIFVIETKNYRGTIRGSRNDTKWMVNGKRTMYNPIRQNRTHINALKRVLSEYKHVPFISIISFTKRCSLYIDHDLQNVESDDIVVYDIKFSEYIERKITRCKREMPTPPLAERNIINVFDLIKQANIKDQHRRDEHIEKIREMNTGGNHSTL